VAAEVVVGAQLPGAGAHQQHALAGDVETSSDPGRSTWSARPAQKHSRYRTRSRSSANASGRRYQEAGGAGYRRRRRRRRSVRRRSRRTCLAALRPGMPVTPPPPWVAEPAWYSPRIGVR
jgi:hypothetical protein